MKKATTTQAVFCIAPFDPSHPSIYPCIAILVELDENMFHEREH
jgi:hypothetical protein